MNMLSKCRNIVISCYLLIMLGYFPLCYKYQYADMGDLKYKVFLYTSVGCVVLFLACSLLQIFFSLKNKKANASFLADDAWVNLLFENTAMSALDIAVLFYFLCNSISFLLTPFKEKGFQGSDGWYMGFLSQILFVGIYFMLSKAWKYQKWVLWLFMASSGMVFLIAILHRFDVDIFNIYGELSLHYKILFLSTMGQASWYSSFLCVTFPVGLYLFFISEERNIRIWSGIYSVIAMWSLVTQNSDSAFLSLAAVLVLFFYLSFDKAYTTRQTKGWNKKQKKSDKRDLVQNPAKRFMEVLLLVTGSFCSMGILQKLFSHIMIPLEKLSLFMSQGKPVWTIFILLAAMYLLVWYGMPFQKRVEKAAKEQKGSMQDKDNNRVLFWIMLSLVVIAVLGLILFIVLNSNGYLYEKYGYQNSNNYLYFDGAWGNNRGYSWKFTITSFAGFSWLQKLFGVGPDCFSAYIASVPEYYEEMSTHWQGLILTNAHNEYLTKLYNLGFAGLSAYLGMLITAVVIFVKNRKENRLLPAFALCTAAYMAHNIFCYEQVCCTPFFYILIGIGSCLLNNKETKCTY